MMLGYLENDNTILSDHWMVGICSSMGFNFSVLWQI